MGVLNLVHEMMHSFGAKHDPDQNDRVDCTPEDKVKHANLFKGTQNKSETFLTKISVLAFITSTVILTMGNSLPNVIN